MTSNILHLMLLLTAHSGSILVHLHYGGVHTASLRATTEDRMGRLLLYSCAVDHIHATRGDFLRPAQCSMCSVCSTVQCTTAQYVQHSVGSTVKCSTYSAVYPVQTGQELFFQLRFSMLLLLLFCLQTPLIPFLSVQHIRIYRQWTLQSYLLWYSLYSRYPWPLPCKILSSVESTGPRSLCSRGLLSRYVLTINYVLKLCVE